jgi:hypothetical protein
MLQFCAMTMTLYRSGIPFFCGHVYQNQLYAILLFTQACTFLIKNSLIKTKTHPKLIIHFFCFHFFTAHNFRLELPQYYFCHTKKNEREIRENLKSIFSKRWGIDCMRRTSTYLLESFVQTWWKREHFLMIMSGKFFFFLMTIYFAQ